MERWEFEIFELSDLIIDESSEMITDDGIKLILSR